MEAKIRAGGDFKNNDLHPIHFDRGGNRPYYTRPMASGLPDRVDCARLAQDAAALERSYAPGELPRLQDLLADARGSVRARFAFAKADSGRARATVDVQAVLHLMCQRCLQDFEFPAAGHSEVEFANGEELTGAPREREFFAMDQGVVSLRELAEEELLLALPIVALHPPQLCGRPADYETDGGIPDAAEGRTRPFTALQTLLKKT